MVLETVKKAFPSSGGGALGSCASTYFLGSGSCWTAALTFFVAHMAYVLASVNGLTKNLPALGTTSTATKFGWEFSALGLSSSTECRLRATSVEAAVLQGIALMVMGRGVYDSLVAMGGSVLGAQGVHAAGFSV